MWERPDELLRRTDVDKMVANPPDSVGSQNKPEAETPTKKRVSDESESEEETPAKKSKKEETSELFLLFFFSV